MTSDLAALAAPTSFESVLHVNEKGGRFGGTEEYVALLSESLARRGVRSHLACGLGGRGLPPSLASTHLVEGLARREGSPATAGELARLVATLRPDVVYLHNIFDPRLVEALDGLRPRPVLLWYVHDHYLTCLTELRLRAGRECRQLLGEGCLEAVAGGACTRRHAERPLGPPQLEERLALLAGAGAVDGVIVVSRYMQDLLRDHLPHLRARVHRLTRPIRTGGDDGRGAREARRRRASPGAAALVAFAGRITPEKGLDVVLEALGRLVVDRPVELQVAGVVEHAEHWEHCQRLAEAAMSANPHLTWRHLGHLGYEETDALFARADLVVVPSRWPEPLGAVTGEALAQGAPVVASAVGGLDTFIEHGQRGGLLAPPGDVAAWTEAIDRLLADPLLAERLAARGAVAARGWSVDAHIDELDQLVAAVQAGQPGDVIALGDDGR